MKNLGPFVSLATLKPRPGSLPLDTSLWSRVQQYDKVSLIMEMIIFYLSYHFLFFFLKKILGFDAKGNPPAAFQNAAVRNPADRKVSSSFTSCGFRNSPTRRCSGFRASNPRSRRPPKSWPRRCCRCPASTSPRTCRPRPGKLSSRTARRSRRRASRTRAGSPERTT